jgi:hypothetical protein
LVWEPDAVVFPSPVLAHQGGWDEMLMVLVPILIFAALLVVANRRASRIGEQQSLAADDGGVDRSSDSLGLDDAADRGGGTGRSGGTSRSGGTRRDAGAEPRRSDGRAGP